MNQERLDEEIRQRVTAVRDEIAAAAARAGRPVSSIRLVAVTKTHPAPVLAAVVRAGVTDIGENYLQEAAEKFAALGWPEALSGTPPVTRHYIGHLQSNKIRAALRWFEIIETVDSLALATRLDRLAGELGRVAPVLLEINISEELTKSGFFSAQLEGVFASLANMRHIRLIGLMTIGRMTPDPEAARADFRALRLLRDRLQRQAPDGVALTELSMGMSHDFPIAIEEGATIIRVGSRLFGPRPTRQ